MRDRSFTITLTGLVQLFLLAFVAYLFFNLAVASGYITDPSLVSMARLVQWLP